MLPTREASCHWPTRQQRWLGQGVFLVLTHFSVRRVLGPHLPWVFHDACCFLLSLGKKKSHKLCDYVPKCVQTTRVRSVSVSLLEAALTAWSQEGNFRFGLSG